MRGKEVAIFFAISAAILYAIKGLFSGLGSLAVALVIGEDIPGMVPLVSALALGLLSYGLSIDLYIRAQRDLGAAKTSAYYSIAPFVGVLIGIFVLGEHPEPMFFIGLGLMVVATVLMISDCISLQHMHGHEHVHVHLHTHDGVEHMHEHTHRHSHLHVHSESVPTHDHTHPPSSLTDHAHH